MSFTKVRHHHTKGARLIHYFEHQGFVRGKIPSYIQTAKTRDHVEPDVPTPCVLFLTITKRQSVNVTVTKE